jgi:hypothetical protein
MRYVKLSRFAAISFIAMSAGLARAEAIIDEACASNAKSIFFRDGKPQSEGGQRPLSPAAMPPTASPSPKLPNRNCRPMPYQQANANTGPKTYQASANQLHAGLAFWTESLRCGEATSHRTTLFRYSTGDCAKFFFMPNTSGYLYVVNIDSSGKEDFLYPLRGESNSLEPGRLASFEVRFVGAPGIESVFVLFSKFRIDDAPRLASVLKARKNSKDDGEHGYSVLLSDGRGSISRSKGLQRTSETVSSAQPDASRYLAVPMTELKSHPILVLGIDLIHESK